MIRLRAILLLILASSLVNGAIAVEHPGLFADPFPVEVGDRPLDVERYGNAAPWLHDLDGDGLRDLLVGESYEGRLRIYRNEGSKENPKFTDFELFKNGDEHGRVPRNHGFCPQVVDFDQDGMADIISPAWYGSVHWFRQSAKGNFDAGRPFVNSDGKPIRLAWTYGGAAVDWNADGRMDLIVGQSGPADNGSFSLLINEGTNLSPAFSIPKPILVGGQAILISAGAPVPTVADWDGDGHFDLIAGDGSGAVNWYRNLGSAKEPTFATAANLLAAPKTEEARGTNAKVCVVDWNLDGKLDLLVGDHGRRFEKQLDELDIKAMEQVQRVLASELANWGRAYRSYSTLLKQGENSNLNLSEARRELVRLNERQRMLRDELNGYEIKQQHHGHVWVFLRR